MKKHSAAKASHVQCSHIHDVANVKVLIWQQSTDSTIGNKTKMFRPRPRPRPDVQDLDQDQDRNCKTKTKTGTGLIPVLS